MTCKTLLIAACAAAAACAVAAGCGSQASQTQKPSYPVVSITVGSRPVGRPLAAGFVGLSLEYTAVRAYADPAAVSLIRSLSPGQRPVVRIGGNSTDETWWSQPAQSKPPGAKFALTNGWLRTTKALATALNAKLILGLNLAGGSPATAAAEARAFERGIGPHYLNAFEIGNEPDLYGLFPWPGDHSLRRPASYSLRDYIREFSRWRSAIGGRLPVAGPAYATFDWSLGRFIDAQQGLTWATFHHYPLDACLTKLSATGYPTIRRLLSDQASSGFAKLLAPAVVAAHAHRIRFRLDELNSASCGGKPGVSNAPASALWILDTLFNLARIGVDGVNVHTFAGAAYAPFSPDGLAYPEYYGMLMFTQAFPPGARLLPATVTPVGPLKAWATEGAAHTTRVVLINKSVRRTYQVRLHVPGLSGSVQIEHLRRGMSTGSPSAITVTPESAVLVTR